MIFITNLTSLRTNWAGRGFISFYTGFPKVKSSSSSISSSSSPWSCWSNWEGVYFLSCRFSKSKFSSSSISSSSFPDYFDRTERGIITIHIGFFYLVTIDIVEAWWRTHFLVKDSRNWFSHVLPLASRVFLCRIAHLFAEIADCNCTIISASFFSCSSCSVCNLRVSSWSFLIFWTSSWPLLTSLTKWEMLWSSGDGGGNLVFLGLTDSNNFPDS